MCLITVELLIISYEQNSEHDAQWAYLKSRTWKVSRLKAAPDSPRANFQKNEWTSKVPFMKFFLFFNSDLI